MPNPKNPNTHPENQIELLGKIIKEQGWRQAIKVSNQSGYIVSGHGRYQAALFIGAKEVPVDYQDYESEEQELADLLADNRIAELAEMDNKMLAEVFSSIEGTDIDTLLSGYTSDEMDEIRNAFYGVELENIDDINSKSEVSTHKLKLDSTVIELTDDEYSELASMLDDYVEANGVTFGFVRWLLNNDTDS